MDAVVGVAATVGVETGTDEDGGGGTGTGGGAGAGVVGGDGGGIGVACAFAPDVAVVVELAAPVSPKIGSRVNPPSDIGTKRMCVPAGTDPPPC